MYQTTDTNLKRAVALKVLPASLASDPDRLAMFQREAEVLAALNHPNIAQIHGLEWSAPSTLSAHSGQAAMIALVMELAEGPTLADILAGSGPLALGSIQNSRPSESQEPKAQSRNKIPLDEALAIAKQIADALEAAHERGIVHRDLRPASVKVRSDGVVPAVAAAKARTAAKEKKGTRSTEARVSTTDPDARVMKFADGGFRPAYNLQFATDGDSGAVVGVAATNVGSDFAEFVPMVEQVQTRTGQCPTALLVDHVVSSNDGITPCRGARRHGLLAGAEGPRCDRPDGPVSARFRRRGGVAPPDGDRPGQDRLSSARRDREAHERRCPDASHARAGRGTRAREGALGGRLGRVGDQCHAHH